MKKVLVLLIGLLMAVSTVSAWQMTITSDTTLTGDVSGTGHGILIDANDVTLDCAGYKISGDSTGYGIYANGKSGVTIKNCVIEDFRFGMYIKSSSDFTITGNTIDLSDSSYAYCRAIYLRFVSDSTVEYNNIEGSTYYGITVAKSSSTGNTIQFNNIKNCPKSTASDSGTDNTWDSNYYDDVIDYDCDGMTTHIISANAVDLNAYVVENGWLGLPTYEDNDGDGYGVNCQLGTDCNDNDPNMNDNGVEDVLDDMDKNKNKLNWEYIWRPWQITNPEDITVELSSVRSISGQSLKITLTDLQLYNDWAHYIDIFYKKDGMDWTDYHTMTFWIYPETSGKAITKINTRLDNNPDCEPDSLFPDQCRENQEGFELVANQWNKVRWNLDMNIYADGGYTPGNPRPVTKDNIKSVRFFVCQHSPSDYYVQNQDISFYIDDIELLRDWKNHGEYVSCVARGSGDVPSAAKSSKGK